MPNTVKDRYESIIKQLESDIQEWIDICKDKDNQIYLLEQQIEELHRENDLEDTEDINDMGINDYGTFDFIEE
jgi:hypothetical protein